MSNIIPTYVYTEMTPNPSTLKFVADRMVIQHGEIAEYFSKEDTIGSSSLAEKLFNFPFVKAVFVMSNFITVTKTDTLQWEDIKDELRLFIQKDLMTSELAVQKIPLNESKKEIVSKHANEEAHLPSEYDEKIQAILEEYVRPAVERDGGAIDYKSFVNGTVTVILKGSCSGCPSATVTLKNGVENLLQSMIPQVKEVVAFEM